MNQQELKARLQTIRQNQFSVPVEVDAFELAKVMFSHIGTTDAELRDRLIYGTLIRWIELNPVFTADQLREILSICLSDEHLFYAIDQPENDGVFKRSFSALIIPLILIAHRDNNFLTLADLQQIQSRLSAYLRQERDLRGYVPDKGWAHAVAHTADALNELSLCTELGQGELVDILKVVQTTIAANSVYAHAEEERLLEVVDSILSRELIAESQWTNWLATFPTLTDKGDLPHGYYRFINVKHFLQALHFRAHHADWPSFVKIGIDAALEALLAD